MGQINPNDGVPNLSFALNFEEPFYDDEQEIPDLGYDDTDAEEGDFDYDDAKRADNNVDNFDDGADRLHDRLLKEAGYEIVNTSSEAEIGLRSEIYDEGYMERIVRSEDVTGLDYLVSDNIIMVVLAEGENKEFIRFHISHLQYHLTDTYTGDRRIFRYVKDGKGKSLIIFNNETNNVERCYTEIRERYVFFIIDNVKYRYDREQKKTQVWKFID